MSIEPEVKPLRRNHRKWFFRLMILVFVCVLPAVVFYATGYRFDFTKETPNIITTGGMYVSVPDDLADIYINNVIVKDVRVFRNASYIQNLNEGIHRVHVQSRGKYTWVKELPVDPHIVIESSSFNMPVIPQLRPITEYISDEEEQVYLLDSDEVDLFHETTSTVPFIISTSTSVLSYSLNDEFEYVSSLFESTSTSSISVFEKFRDSLQRFRFSTSTINSNLLSATATVERNNMLIFDREDEIYASWKGSPLSIPYYFCIVDYVASTTANKYGEHVAESILEFNKSTTTPLLIDGNRVCRPEIKLDRLKQDVYFYDFFPNTSDLVLLKLDEGLYVTEIDDRAWQNTQLLYSGKDFKVVVENNQIFIYDNGFYFEIITEIAPN